ncbi:MAG: hypothetical protein ABH828_00720 [archaeon]
MKHECSGWIGWLVLLVGLFYLLVDYGVGWMGWWKLSWFTTVLILFGLHKITKKK